jgi:hypothetical protein
MNNWLNNNHHRSNIPDPTEDQPKCKNAENLWAQDNKALVDKNWADICLEDPSLINNPGRRRGAVCDLWHDLTPEQQLPYRERAKELKRQALLKPVLTAEDREE